MFRVFGGRVVEADFLAAGRGSGLLGAAALATVGTDEVGTTSPDAGAAGGANDVGWTTESTSRTVFAGG